MRGGSSVGDGSSVLGGGTTDRLEETLRLGGWGLHARSLCLLRVPGVAYEFLLQETGHGAYGLG